MKNIRLLFVLFFLVAGCNKDDENNNNNQVTEDPSDLINLQLQGISITDFSGIDVVHLGVEKTINENGAFPDPFTLNEIEESPITFVKDNNILFGYFASDLLGNELNNDHLIKFFVKTYPEIAIRGIDSAVIDEALEANSLIADLENQIIVSLNNLESPIENEMFNEILMSISNEIVENSREENLASREIVGEFRFVYTREGEISWPVKAPLFSALGASIKNVTTDEVILDNQLLHHQGLSLSPTSIISFLHGLISSEDTSQLQSINMTTEGEYQIVFTNGQGDSSLDNYVIQENADIFGAHCVGIISPFNLKTLNNLSTECSNAVAESLSEASNFLLENVITDNDVSSQELKEFLEGLGDDLITTVTTCVPDIKLSKYFTYLIKFTIKRLSLALESSELLFFYRDFMESDISGEEIRYFSNGQSVGELGMNLNTPESITLPPNSDFSFNSDINETDVSYDVDRTLSESQFIKVETESPAEGLIFDISILSGDTSLNNDGNPLVSDENGNLEYGFISGYQDSEIEIAPSFITPDITSNTIEVIIDYETLVYSADNIDFGTVDINTSNSISLLITNSNEYDVQLDLSLDSDYFSVDTSELLIEALATNELTLFFNPIIEGNFSSVLSADVQGLETKEILLTGIGQDISEEDINNLLLSNDWETQGFVDENGETDCYNTISAVYPYNPQYDSYNEGPGNCEYRFINFYSDNTVVVGMANQNPDIYNIHELNSSYELIGNTLQFNYYVESSPINDPEKTFIHEVSFDGVFNGELNAFIGSFVIISTTEYLDFSPSIPEKITEWSRSGTHILQIR